VRWQSEAATALWPGRHVSPDTKAVSPLGSFVREVLECGSPMPLSLTLLHKVTVSFSRTWYLQFLFTFYVLRFTHPLMELKYIALTDPLYRYLASCRSHTSDRVLESLRRETDALGDISKMQISEEQGSFMTILVAAIGAKSAIEVGTFTGYSSICIARGLTQTGRLICVDESKEWTDIAQKHWTQAGVASRIELRLGAAIPLLQKLESGLVFDFAFIDASKTEYEAYYELLLHRIRPNGLILFDNMLWGGRLGTGTITEASGRAIDALNHKLANDNRVESVLLPIADGLQLCRKL
jgi:caffeoyl-CoA O-methyltransferase